MLSISSLKPMIRLQMSFTVFITLITTECIHGEFVCLVIYVVCLKDRLTNSRERLVPATANQQEEPFSVLHHWRSNRWSRWTEWWRKEYTWRKKKRSKPLSSAQDEHYVQVHLYKRAMKNIIELGSMKP